MPRFFHRTTALCTSLIAVGLLAACASTTPSPALEEARTAVSTAAGDPAVNQYAQLELKQATDALAQADRVWADDKDTSETNHLAYIAASVPRSPPTRPARASSMPISSRPAAKRIASACRPAPRRPMQPACAHSRPSSRR